MTLERLFNKLIEKGWNVFGHKDRINAEKCEYSEGIFYEFENHNMSISLRELVSKESGLWQFVCENGMQKKRPPYNRDSDTYGFTIQEYQYRIIESALRDESELEKFLIDNIKI